jgi:hypothetical protein
LKGNPAASPFRNDVDPLQLSFARVTTGEMARCEAHDRALLQCDVTSSRCESVLWVELTVEVPGDAVLPILQFTPVASSDTSHGRDVGLF